MARHQISAAKPKPAIGPAPSSYETTHPVGSAERFLDQAARDALAAAAVGGVPPLSRFIPGQPVIRESQTTTPIGKPLGGGGGQFPSGVQWAAKGGNTRSDSKGGDASGPETPVSETPVSETAAQQQGGPRIVINPQVFNDKRDALCVAFNEALRIVMEETGFDPVSEPTDAQREFFADTAYADDELQLRRTILARICTFDTSVKDPTDEQIQEAIEFVSSVMEGGFPRNEWEQSCLKKILDILSSVPIAPNDGSPRTPVEPPQEADPGATASELGGQTQKEEERDLTAGGAILADLKYDAQGPAMGPQKDSEVPLDSEKQDNRNLTAGGAILADPKYDVQGPAVRKEDELQ